MRVLTEPSHRGKTSENIVFFVCFSLFSSRIVHKVQNLLQTALLAVQFSWQRLTECPPCSVVVLTNLNRRPPGVFLTNVETCKKTWQVSRKLHYQESTLWKMFDPVDKYHKNKQKQRNMCSEACPLRGFQSSQDSLKYICFLFWCFLLFLFFFDIFHILSIGQAFLLDATVVQPFLAVQFSWQMLTQKNSNLRENCTARSARYDKILVSGFNHPK